MPTSRQKTLAIIGGVLVLLAVVAVIYYARNSENKASERKQPFEEANEGEETEIQFIWD